MPRQRQVAAWTAHDDAILSTLRIVRSLLSGDQSATSDVVADFPAQIASDERLLASGAVDVLAFRASGHGTYLHHGPPLVLGRQPAATAVVAAVTVVGNRARRRKAIVDAQPRWVLDTQGAIWVSTAGFYLRAPSGLYPWSWDAVRAACLVEPGAVRVDGEGSDSAVSWVLRTEWAELLLLLWTLARHPAHPQLRDGSWLPSGWRARAEQLGFLDPIG